MGNIFGRCLQLHDSVDVDQTIWMENTHLYGCIGNPEKRLCISHLSPQSLRGRNSRLGNLFRDIDQQESITLSSCTVMKMDKPVALS